MAEMTFIPFIPFVNANGSSFSQVPYVRRESRAQQRQSPQQPAQPRVSYEEKSCVHCLRDGRECDGNRPCLVCLTLGRSDACYRLSSSGRPANAPSDSVVIRPLDLDGGEFVTLRSSAIYEPVQISDELSAEKTGDKMKDEVGDSSPSHSREPSSGNENATRKRKRSLKQEADSRSSVASERGVLTRKRSKTGLNVDVASAPQTNAGPDESTVAPLVEPTGLSRREHDSMITTMCWREGSWDPFRAPSSVFDVSNFLSTSLDAEFNMSLNLSSSIRNSSHSMLTSSLGASLGDFPGQSLLNESSTNGGFDMDLDRFSAGVPL